MEKTKLKKSDIRWDLISKLKNKSGLKKGEVIKQLLENRGVKTKKQIKEFFKPTSPQNISLSEFGIDKKVILRSIARIKQALKKKEKTIIFGDYDVDGVCSTAILWEYLYRIGLDITPHIPERFTEGYGIKPESVDKLKKQFPKLSLIITVDNGIVAFDAIEKAKKMGVDVVIVDHHEVGEKYPNAHTIIHTKKLCGAGISWVLVRELRKKFSKIKDLEKVDNALELAALGTVADQMPLLGVNRSIVKYGLEKLNSTSRIGLISLFETSGLSRGHIGIYEVNYVIAPRLNAMGRLEHAIESLRLICTKSKSRAYQLAQLLNKTNAKRQKIVEDSIKKIGSKGKGVDNKIVVIDDPKYHEGVVGLIASKLVEEFSRPAIVISRGKEISKGSARSVWGFSIIDAIHSADKVLIGAGGHQMAAGFVLKSSNVDKFRKQLQDYCDKKLKSDLLQKKIKIDFDLDIKDLSNELAKEIEKMQPFGIGNPTPVFAANNCLIKDVRKVGRSGNHLKFVLEKNGVEIEGLLFNSRNEVSAFTPGEKMDVAYNLEENYWNGLVSLQLKIKDLR